MISWKVTKFGKIEKTKHQELLAGLDSVKVKLTRALVTEDDIAYICGEDKSIQLPIIPVRHAIGQITETAQPHDFITKGSRVVLSSIEPCGECPACEAGHHENCYNFGIAGRNREGFLKDFAVTNVSSVFALPASVKDADAVYVEYVALALSIIDKLNVQKSSHVAIIGGGVFASILGQILIYYHHHLQVSKNVFFLKHTNLLLTLKLFLLLQYLFSLPHFYLILPLVNNIHL